PLNASVSQARSEGAARTARLLEGITSLLRRVLDDTVAMVALTEELVLAREYLEVQRVRFGDRLHYAIECADEATVAVVPSLILQPLVENAVEHGTSQTLEGGTVSIAERVIEGLLEVTV